MNFAGMNGEEEDEDEVQEEVDDVHKRGKNGK